MKLELPPLYDIDRMDDKTLKGLQEMLEATLYAVVITLKERGEGKRHQVTVG